MQNKTYIGIDNGVSGSIGILFEKPIDALFFKMPVMVKRDYQKTKMKTGKLKYITRIDFVGLSNILKTYLVNFDECFALIERPFTHPDKYYSTISAARACEATIIILELLDIQYDFIDSRSWQGVLLPSGIKGRENLKNWSQITGKRMFPHIEIGSDADGLLIAHYAKIRRM
jgi:hypothetical protein